jgi:hypothetical protein
MFEKCMSFFVNPEQPGCVIENGILISYEVTSPRCVIPEGVTELRGFAINRGRDQITEVVLPSTIRHLGEHSFSGCKNLKTINFPEGLQVIESKALDDCDALEQVILPDSLESIADDAFEGCVDLLLICREGTFGETYAKANQIPYIIVP